MIPTYNCPFIGSAIESALAQSYGHKEVIVVNDGSTEHTELIQPYLDRIRYMEKSNGGTGSALNAGIREARGQYFTWLSSDDLYAADKLEKQLAYMGSVQADACYSAFDIINEHNQITGTFRAGFGDRRAFYEAMRAGNVINGCTVMLKREVFDHVGLFDESLKCTQDYDLWCRILQHYHFHYLDEPLVQYRVHSGMSTKKLSDTLAKERSYVQQRYSELFQRLLSR
ncbi:glycosyltransferase [Paenibacillus sp. PL2-23]|uniref:glycosyltransferase n=1 Tax=Paenibacillus sp. PL2-23 TaxID=2100729 RepID=UPI0030F6C34A